MSSAMDSDLHFGQIAVRMGLLAPQDLPGLLQEARGTQGAGHTRGGSLAQLLLRKKLLSVSDYLYMARQARVEVESGQGELAELELALDRYASGELDVDSFEEIVGASGEPLARPKEQVQRFGPYELVREVARGGMGIVYDARDTRADRKQVALKVMIEADDDEVRLQRFEREAELAAALDHPNIVRIHDAGRIEGMPYFTMDLVEGESLDDLLEGDGIPRDLAIRALAQVASAVDHAHSRGIIHRDLKPGNILIEHKSGAARITDFGLARDLHRGTRLTQVGQAVGTPYYMAPEQVRGERDVDGRCDVYAIGVMLYEILTGDVPFDADSPLSLFRKIDREEITLQLDPENGVDEHIRNIALRALAKEREERYSRGRLLSEDLERYLRGAVPKLQPYDVKERVLSTRLGLTAAVLGALALVLVLVAGTLAFRRYQTGQAEARGREALTQSLAQVAEAVQAGDAALGSSAFAAARERAEAAEATLGDVEGLLAREGSEGEGARQAFQEQGGAEWVTQSRRLLAQALAREATASGDPALADRARDALRRAIELDPREVSLRLDLAAALRRAGRPSEALAELSAVLDVDSAHEEALLRRADLRLELGRAEEAAADLSSVLLQHPDRIPALIGRSRAYLALDRHEVARRDAENARDLAPERPEPFVACGDVARARGDERAALEAYSAAARLALDDPRPHLRAGALLAARGSHEAAIAAYERARERSGGWPCRYGRARALTALMRLEPATRELRAALAEDGNAGRVELQTLLGEVQLIGGRLDEARETFLRASEMGEGAVLARVWLARLALDHAKDAALARQFVDRLDPSLADAELLALRAQIALEEGSFDDSRSLAERAVAAATGRSRARARRALARVRLQRAQGEAARAACLAAWGEETRGQDLISVYLQRGLELAALGAGSDSGLLIEEAERLLLIVLRLDAQRAPAWMGLADLHAARNHYNQAWEALRRALRLDPFHGPLVERLARTALRLEQEPRLQRAIQALELAIDFEGPTATRLMLLARLLVAVEEWARALAALDRAVQLAPTEGEVQELRARVLESLGRDTGAQLAATRARELGPERDARRRKLYQDARSAETSDPQRAMDLAHEAVRLSIPGRHRDAAEIARFLAGLVRNPEERLEVLAPTLLLPGWDLLDRADRKLAPLWRRPLSGEVHTRLVLRTQEDTPAAHLSVALAAVYDGLSRAPDTEGLEAWLSEALGHAEEAVRRAPAAITAHMARGYLRVHSGDAQRGLRELLNIEPVAGDSPFYQFVLAEAAAASGDAKRRDEALERVRGRELLRLEARLRCSPFLSE